LHQPVSVNLLSPSWMMIRLALETKSHHAAADADRLALLEDATPERYRTFLKSVYCFETRYESALVRAPDVDPRLIRARSKAHHLRDDLYALGVHEDDLAAMQPVIPPFRSEAEALGWVYVVERNTLLHGLLRRALWRAMPTTIDRAGSYLGAYGNAPGSHYRDLGADLDGAARRAIPSQMIEAANAAFACQRLWFARAQQAKRRVAS
jgi:heme oxygenase